jgi:hypothetical protein
VTSCGYECACRGLTGSLDHTSVGLCQGAVVGINSSAPLIAVDPMLVSIVKTYHSMHCDMLIPMMCGFLLSLIIHFSIVHCIELF